MVAGAGDFIPLDSFSANMQLGFISATGFASALFLLRSQRFHLFSRGDIVPFRAIVVHPFGSTRFRVQLYRHSTAWRGVFDPFRAIMVYPFGSTRFREQLYRYSTA